nr:hypothetical protein [Nanoarchaeum sp.]
MQPIKEAHIRKSCLGNMVRIDWDRSRNAFLDSEGNSVEGIDPSNGKPGVFVRYYDKQTDGDLVFGQSGVRVDGVNVSVMTHYSIKPDYRVSPDLDGKTRCEHPVTFYELRR